MKITQVTLLALLSLSAFIANAAGDPVAGKDKAQVCASCHGADGNSAMPDWPKLAGQGAKYIEAQLVAFKAGDRKNPLMAPLAAGLSEQDMADVAAYFTTQKVTTGQADPELVARGRELYEGGDAGNKTPACMACHGPSGSGNPAAAYPALKGQHAKYTATQLNAYRSGERTHVVMQGVASKMSDADIEAVSSYISGLH